VTDDASADQAEMWREDITERIRQHEADSPYRLNPDERVVEALVKGLLRRRAEFGDFYCPCRVVTGNAETDARNVCPCETHAEEIAATGKCHCGLFVGDKQDA